MEKINGTIPLYKQLKKSLYDQIESGLFKPGQLIPSERTLCQQYNMSRITVRRCIEEMTNEGMLYRRHGKGTFVAPSKVKQGLARIVTFSQTVLELGMKPSTAILSTESIAADVQIARVFALPIATLLLELALLGKGDDQPLVLYESFFPPKIGEKMVREAMVREKEGIPFSTYDLYGEPTGILPATVNQTFEATVADERMSQILNLEKGAPVLLITSIFLNGNQEPLEFRKATYRADRYKFHILRDFSA
ncbi:MAG: GntR family transcriptional regulator [Thermodesulfobacteriota bacterium]